MEQALTGFSLKRRLQLPPKVCSSCIARNQVIPFSKNFLGRATGPPLWFSGNTPLNQSWADINSMRVNCLGWPEIAALIHYLAAWSARRLGLGWPEIAARIQSLRDGT